jgi:dihydropteroate synthase
MRRSLYIRPVGPFVAAPEPRDGLREDEIGAYAATHWRGLPLAGTRLSFAAVELIEREARGSRRRVAALGDLFERDWGRDTMPAADMMEALTAPRSRLAGLALDRPRVMGIINVTPDSFSDGGRHVTADKAIAHALRLVEEGADIIDIGGESTRPGADPVTLDEELARVMPVLEGLRAKTSALISIDTRKAEVMRRAAAAGADILNDVSALTYDPAAPEAAAASGLPVILMHAQGDPKTMNDNPVYDDVVLDVFDFLERRIRDCEAAGIPKAKLVVDPGIGFGKHLSHNVAVLNAMSLYHGLGVPILLGASRKKLVDQLCDVPNAGDRLPGSLAAALHAIAHGVQIVRVHDVAATRQAIAVWQAVAFGTEAAARG